MLDIINILEWLMIFFIMFQDMCTVFDTKKHFKPGVVKEYDNLDGSIDIQCFDYLSDHAGTICWIGDSTLLTLSESGASGGPHLKSVRLHADAGGDGGFNVAEYNSASDFDMNGRISAGPLLGLAVSAPSNGRFPNVASFNSDGQGRIAVFRQQEMPRP